VPRGFAFCVLDLAAPEKVIETADAVPAIAKALDDQAVLAVPIAPAVIVGKKVGEQLAA
jgi:hypothetical protein